MQTFAAARLRACPSATARLHDNAAHFSAISMVARLLKLLCFAATLGVLAAAGLLSGWARLLCLVSLLGAYPAVLASEFALARHVAGRQGASRPHWAQWLRGWATELRQGCSVFLWRQPFRADAVADHLPVLPRRGVVFIHGLFCNRGFWNPWMLQARARGLPCLAVNLEPVMESIDHYVPIVEAAVARMESATGQPPVLVGHSMGGLVGRAWLSASAENASRVTRVITIASPHAGTWMAKFGHGANVRQMRQGSPWLRALEKREAVAPGVPFMCWSSDVDNVVFPAGTATRDGADHRPMSGIGHMALAFHPRVIGESLAAV